MTIVEIIEALHDIQKTARRQYDIDPDTDLGDDMWRITERAGELLGHIRENGHTDTAFERSTV
jgi:hypothetical protein